MKHSGRMRNWPRKSQSNTAVDPGKGTDSVFLIYCLMLGLMELIITLPLFNCGTS